MEHLSQNHFLRLPRPDATLAMPQGVPDTSTLAAHDFDVDTRTGFMPPEPPLDRLPVPWAPWEQALDDAMERRLQLGSDPDTTTQDADVSATWRERVREMPILSTVELFASEVQLRRAHSVLAWLIHFYVHTLPTSSEVFIPRSISIPQLQISTQLQLPPVLTYSDDVLYNWAHLSSSLAASVPMLDNLRTLLSFTGTSDESEFYLSSARIELRGVSALALMRATMDEAFVGDSLAMKRITLFLNQLAAVVDDMTTLLLKVRDGCDPDVFYRRIRPWFKGEDSTATPSTRKWTFEGVGDDAYPGLKEPVERSGPSAGQSSLVHSLDIFLGVDEFSHSPTATPSTSTDPKDGPSFLARMQSYMPRHHRAFLRHLSSNPRPLRSLVLANGLNVDLLGAYNRAVSALKKLRDAHMRIVTLYIIAPAHRAHLTEQANSQVDTAALKGTGGTDLVRFLRDVRDRTAAAALSSDA